MTSSDVVTRLIAGMIPAMIASKGFDFRARQASPALVGDVT